MFHSKFRFVTALVLVVFSLPLASAAAGDPKGKPGGGSGDGPDCLPGARFPALIYPVDSGDGNGTRNLVAASSDGCVQSVVEHGIQLGRVRLRYDEGTASGYYAWSENVFPGLPPGSVKRQHFTVSDGVLTPTGLEVLYEGVGYLTDFDLQGGLLAVVDEALGALLVVDLSACEGGLSCVSSDGVAVYRPDTHCLSDTAIVGCYQPQPELTMASSGATIYFSVLGNDSSGTRIYGIARATRGTDGWAAQLPELYLRDDNYRELRPYGLSADDRHLAAGYLAGFQKSGLRDDRGIILDTAAEGEGCPCEAADFIQDFPAWTAAWTVDNTLYVLGTAGKGRHYTFPIEEFDPVTGARTALGISLEDHPPLDSSL